MASGNVSSVSLAKPSGTQNGDLLIASLSCNWKVSAFVASGWTQILVNYGNNVSFGAWYKYAGSSEPSTYPFSWTTAAAPTGFIVRKSNPVASNPIDASAYAEMTNSLGVYTAPSITTTVAGDALFTAFFQDGFNLPTWTLPSGETNTSGGNQEYDSSSDEIVITGGTETIASAGAVGTRTASTTNSTATKGGAFVVAVKVLAATLPLGCVVLAAQKHSAGSPFAGQLY